MWRLELQHHQEQLQQVEAEIVALGEEMLQETNWLRLAELPARRDLDAANVRHV
jgi:hypothetical protein